MPERRTSQRTLTAPITCNRGTIIDLSINGMRLRSRLPWGEGTQRRITLKHNGAAVSLWAECVWRRKDAPFQHITGLAFVNPSDDARTFIQNALNSATFAPPILIPMGAHADAETSKAA